MTVDEPGHDDAVRAGERIPGLVHVASMAVGRVDGQDDTVVDRHSAVLGSRACSASIVTTASPYTMRSIFDSWLSDELQAMSAATAMSADQSVSFIRRPLDFGRL